MNTELWVAHSKLPECVPKHGGGITIMIGLL